MLGCVVSTGGAKGVSRCVFGGWLRLEDHADGTTESLSTLSKIYLPVLRTKSASKVPSQ